MELPANAVAAIAAFLIAAAILSSRGPLVVAPNATLRVYRRLLDTNGRVRAIGLLLAVLSAFALVGADGVFAPGAEVLRFLGWLFAAGAAWLLALPRSYANVALRVLDSMDDPTTLRFLGLIGVSIGLAIGWLGYSLL